MKTISNYISESKDRYVLIYVKDGFKGMIHSDNYKNEEIFNDSDYCEVYDNTKANFSELDSLICFKGKYDNGFWYGIMKNSENPENAPKWATILKKNDLQRLKQKFIS